MKKLLLSMGLLTALALTSCKKDDKPGNPGNGGDGTPAAKYLKKLTKVENGVTTVYNFNYDNANHLLDFTSTAGNESTSFSYDAAGNLTKVEGYEDGFKTIYTYTWANNRPVSGTFKSWEITAGEPDNLIESDKLTYTLTGEQVTKIHLEPTDGGAITDFDLSYTNGNLTKVQSAAQGIYTVNFEFGTKKPAFPAITKFVLDQAGYSLLFGSKNELIKSTYDFLGDDFDYTTTTAYTYDSNGYPLTSDDGDTKASYEYTKPK